MRQVDHSPGRPVSGEDVAVTVKATDPDGVASVTLEYQLVDPGAYIAFDDPAYATAWTALPMHDDGLDGDAVGGDAVYSVVLPGALQTHRRLVRYRITAEDGTGLDVTVPYLDDPQANFAYFVYDGVPDFIGAAEPGVSSPVVYGSSVMDSLPVYHLISKSGDVEDSNWDDKYGGSDYPWTGTLVYEGEVYDHIHYRARGGGWRYAMGKNMWKFDLNRGHPLEAEDNYGRAERR